MATARLEFSPLYGFVRSRQLEGTFPGVASKGVYGSSTFRVKRGWGNILESEWPYAKNTAAWPPIEPPGLDAKAKKYRILRYQWVTNTHECKRAIPIHGGVAASFEVTQQWFHADNGVIEMPAAGDPIIASHAVHIIGYDDVMRKFTFANSWGPSWGDKGYGYLPYEFFDKWSVEAFIVDGVGEFPSKQPKNGIGGIAWAKRDFSGRVFFAREFYDADADERIGWAFALQKNDHLGVEELYVRPQFRRQGYGTRLLQSLRELSNKTGLSLQFLIPFADSQPSNFRVVEKILSKEGYHLFPSGLRWCSIVASTGLKTSPGAPLIKLPSPPRLISPSSKTDG
jgi:GNAT superfamily N-acetyltransferase